MTETRGIKAGRCSSNEQIIETLKIQLEVLKSEAQTGGANPQQALKH